MTDEPRREKVRADEVEGLRELITQVLHEERAVFYPRSAVEDMEELRRSPAGAVIRLEEKVDRLGEDVADIKEELAGIRTQMVTKAELHQLERRMQRVEESTKEEFQSVRTDLQRVEESLRADLERVEESLRADLQRVEESTKEEFQSVRADLRRLEEAQADFVTKEDFREHGKRIDRLEKEVHAHHVDMVRMFFVLLIVMILLNGDKVIQFLSLLIP